MKPCSVALADDHVLIRNGLAGLINSFDGYKVVLQAINGQELIDKLNPRAVPDVILLDINMPKKDGYDTATWIKNNYPEVKILALSMYDNESAIIRMLKNGARGYVLKDAEPADLKRALDDVVEKGFYYSELVTGHLMSTIHKMGDDYGGRNILNLNDREIDFLKYVCTELTYKEIADKMYLSPRTIDGYRDALFEKLHIKTRVGLAIYAIRNGIVNLDEVS